MWVLTKTVTIRKSSHDVIVFTSIYFLCVVQPFSVQPINIKADCWGGGLHQQINR